MVIYGSCACGMTVGIYIPYVGLDGFMNGMFMDE
jgi:hypothetical protein